MALEDDWKNHRVWMMDFEGSPATGVVEAGVVLLEGGALRQCFSFLCRPATEIPERDRAVHGIDADEAALASPFAEHYGWFVGLRRDGIFAAHNRHAENQFLGRTWPLPPRVPDWTDGSESVHTWGPWIDTLALYRSFYPGLEGYGLGDLVRLFALGERLANTVAVHCPEERRKPHCALYDALASSLLLLRLEEEADLRGRLSLGSLFRASGELSGQGELF